MRHAVIAIALSLSLAACTVPTSAPQLAPRTAGDLGLTGPAAPLPASRWWESFKDPQLDRLVEQALADSPTLEAAGARLRRARAGLAAARATDGPDIAADGDAQVARLSGRSTIPPPYRGSVRFLGTVGADLDWNLDLFGRQRAAIDGARASVRAAALDTEAARLVLVGAVVQTYLELARSERIAAIAAATIAVRERALHLREVRAANQLASNLDTSAGEALVAQARQRLEQAHGARALIVDALAALTGHGVDAAGRIAPTSLDLDVAMALPASLPADLLARRPDIGAAQARIEAADGNRAVARRAFYPNVNLTAMIGLEAVGIGNLFNPDAATIGGGGAIHLPIFDHGRLRAELAKATADLDGAIADYDRAVVAAVQESADGLATIGNLSDQRRAARAALEGWRTVDRLQAARARNGLETRLDRVDNDVRLLDAELVDAGLTIDAAIARARLATALGGGFTSEGEANR